MAQNLFIVLHTYFSSFFCFCTQLTVLNSTVLSVSFCFFSVGLESVLRFNGISVDGHSLRCPRSKLFWGFHWTACDRSTSWLYLFTRPQLWDLLRLLTFACLSCGMLIIHPMLCWFQECRGGRQTFPQWGDGHGKINPRSVLVSR